MRPTIHKQTKSLMVYTLCTSPSLHQPPIASPHKIALIKLTVVKSSKQIQVFTVAPYGLTAR